MGESALPLEVVQSRLSQIRAKNICLILDCCQSEAALPGRGTAQTMADREETSLDVLARDIVFLRKTERNENSGDLYQPTVVVLNSCRKGQRAYESPEQQHGLFTAQLLDASGAVESSGFKKEVPPSMPVKVPEPPKPVKSAGPVAVPKVRKTGKFVQFFKELGLLVAWLLPMVVVEIVGLTLYENTTGVLHEFFIVVSLFLSFGGIQGIAWIFSHTTKNTVRKSRWWIPEGLISLGGMLLMGICLVCLDCGPLHWDDFLNFVLLPILSEVPCPLLSIGGILVCLWD